LHASAPDAPWLENGFYPGANGKVEFSAPPVAVDQIFSDKDIIRLGELSLMARLTPGHSPGCTSWFLKVADNGETYDVLIFGSATVAGNRLEPEQYPGIVDDYKSTFEKMRKWQPDIVLSNHPDSFFDQEAKMERHLAGEPRAFVDREIFQTQIEDLQKTFEQRLKAPR